MSTLNSCPRRNNDFAWRIIDGEVVAVALEEGSSGNEVIFVFNETATRIWQLINGRNTIETIIKKIVCEYDCEIDKVRHEIQHVFETFTEKKMII